MSKEKVSREELFEKTPVRQAIFTLTIPMIISSMTGLMMNYLMIIRVSSLLYGSRHCLVTLAHT